VPDIAVAPSPTPPALRGTDAGAVDVRLQPAVACRGPPELKLAKLVKPGFTMVVCST